jgi:hypothetical protein
VELVHNEHVYAELLEVKRILVLVGHQLVQLLLELLDLVLDFLDEPALSAVLADSGKHLLVHRDFLVDVLLL